jgi:hypothetical protein
MFGAGKSRNVLLSGAFAGAAVWGGLETSSAFLAPTMGRSSQPASAEAAALADVAQYGAPRLSTQAPTSGWSAAMSLGAAVGIMGAASYAKGRAPAKAAADAEAGLTGREVTIPIGKGGFVGSTGESLTVISRCPKTGRARAQQVRAATAMAAGSGTKTAINGFGRIGRNVLRCWIKREE